MVGALAPIVGSVIGAGASLLGGSLANKANKQIAQQNLDSQKEFAQNSIQWRVADAKKAGLHPLYALGANTPSYTPSSYQDSFGGAISDAGQQIGRAVGSIDPLARENQKLQNDLLRSQIESQKLQNASIAGQNSSQQAKVNEALVAPFVTEPILSKKPPKEAFSTERGYRNPLGSETQQALSDYASEHPFLNSISTYMDLPPNVKANTEVDVLRSLSPKGVYLVRPSDGELTAYQYFTNWLRDKGDFIFGAPRRLFGLKN